MSRLDDITLEELHEVREQTEGEKPRERVLAAIGRKQGDQLDTLAERHGVVEKTIRNWLDRLFGKPIEPAPYDAPRPGGPSKFTTDQREHLEEVLQDPPTELGYNQQAWSPKLLLHYVAREYNVEYSKRHARYLMTEAELSWRTARPRNREANPEEEAKFQLTVKKPRTSREDDRYRRPVHQACWHGPAAWLVPDRLGFNDRDVECLGEGDSAWRCHRRD